MATDAELQAALTFGTNHLGVSAKTVGSAQLARIKAFITAEEAGTLGGETVTSEDVACWLWSDINRKVKIRENKKRDTDNDAAAVADLTA